MQIGIGNHQHIVRRRRQHIDQVGHFGFRPCPVGSTTTAMSQSGNRACSRRTTGSAVSAASCTPNTTCHVGKSWRQMLANASSSNGSSPCSGFSTLTPGRHPSPDQQRPIDKPPHCRPARNGLHHADPRQPRRQLRQCNQPALAVCGSCASSPNAANAVATMSFAVSFASASCFPCESWSMNQSGSTIGLTFSPPSSNPFQAR